MFRSTRVRPEYRNDGWWCQYPRDNNHSHKVLIAKDFLAPPGQSVLAQTLYLLCLAPYDSFLYPKLKSALKS